MSSRRSTADEAKALLKAPTPGPWVTRTGSFGAVYSVGPIEPSFSGNGLECDEADADLAAAAPDLAHTVISQAEQITRLQQAVRRIMTDFTEADAAIVNEYGTPRLWEPPKIEEYGLTPEDMEEN